MLATQRRLAGGFSLLLTLLSLSIFIFPSTAGVPTWGAEAEAQQFVEEIPVEEWLGPLAPIALSPFFGLTCLSGASMAADKGLIPDRALYAANPTLGHVAVFWGLLLLTLLTSVPRLTKVSKSFTQAMDGLETYSVIVVYMLMLWLVPDAPEETQVVYNAGMVSFTLEGLLLIFSVCNIIVINTVKAFFELAILFSPIPLIDAAFEIANKVVCAGLMAVFIWSPTASFVLDVIILLVCLRIYKWARSRMAKIKEELIPACKERASNLLKRIRPSKGVA